MAPDQVIADENKIRELIPQKEPFVMVDRLYSTDEKTTVSGFKVKNDHVFFSEGNLTEPALIENIAQTAAARVGYECERAGIAVPVGFIGAIKNLRIYSLPELNTELKTIVTIDYLVMDFTLITGKIYKGEELIAECEMKIFLKKE